MGKRNADSFDQEMMARALRLARRGEGYVEPNPMVGCVIVKNSKIIGQGYHRRFGGPHAEIVALRSCKKPPTGATVYCTLEPCTHFGKTPPCVDSLIDTGVARVVIPILDPNPQVHGRGARKLRRAGIKVEVGVMADEAAELIRPFATRTLLDRPYVIAKWAQSANGFLIPGPGEPRWISGVESRRRVHQLRARVDAIMVGAGTVLKDDPLLTARGVRVKRVATRIIVDGRLRIPVDCKLVRTAGKTPTVVVTTAQKVRSRKAKVLCEAGVLVAPCRARGGSIVLDDLLRLPELTGATNLLVEGGPALLNAFFRAGLVDEAHVYESPRKLHPRAPAAAVVKYGRVLPESIRTLRSGKDKLQVLKFAPTQKRSV